MNQNKRLFITLLMVPVLLLIPFIAMQLSDEVYWSAFDFTVMGVLLTLTGICIEGFIRTVKIKQNRIAWIVVMLLLFLIIWVELAVGIFGSPFAGS